MANNFKSNLSSSIGTTAISVYTTPTNTTTTVIGLTLCNTSTVQISCDVYITRSSVNYYLGKGLQIPVGTSIVPIGGEQKVVLQAGDIIKVISNNATSCDVVISVLELS